MKSKADMIAHLRSRIAEIPARADGPSPSPLPAALASHVAGVRPQVSAQVQEILSVPEPLAPLLPHRGLIRRSIVHVAGVMTLRLGLLASVTGSGSWAGVGGFRNLGLLATAEMGADLARCALVSDPGTDPVTVVAVLLDGLDLVVRSRSGVSVPPSRARKNGAVLVVSGGSWPALDLHLDAQVAGYRGIDTAGGCVTGLNLTVEARARGRRRRGEIALAGPSGGVRWVPGQSAPEALKAAR